VTAQKIANRCQDALINFILRLASRFELGFSNEQGVVPAFNDKELVWCRHFAANTFQDIQGTEPVAGSLYEKDWLRQFAEHLGPQPGWIPTTAERVAKADDSRHRFFQREMAPHPCPKAFANENSRSPVLLPGAHQRFAVSGNELWQRVGTLLSFQHVRIVENTDGPDRSQPFCPTLHPRM